MRRIAAVVISTALVLPSSVVSSSAAPQRSSTLAADLVVAGEAPDDQSGHQVEVADLDGDGIGDLVVGAWQNDSGGEASGAVYVEYGPLTKSFNLKAADAKLFPPAAGEYAGEGPLGIADLDGDGADDIVIGAPGSFYVAQPGSPGKIGEAFLVYGGKRLRGRLPLTKVADARFTGVHLTEWLGFGSSGVGDLDDDGRDEVLIGAPGTAGFTGAAYLFYGDRKRLKGDVPVTGADATFLGARSGEMFGYEAAGGDVDGDGDDDLFIASKPLAGGPSSISQFLGGERLSGVIPAAAAHSQLIVPTLDYFTGPALASGSDVTGDRVDDLVVGTGVYLNPAAQSATYIFGGSKSAFAGGPGLGTPWTSLVGSGDAVALGDVNRDGRTDVVTGAPYGSDGGSVYVFYGPIRNQGLVLDDAGAVFEGETGSEAGAALATGRVGKSRTTAVIVGAPADAGRTYVILRRR